MLVAVDFTMLTDRVKALKAELAEIQALNEHYFKQLHHSAVELQVHVRRRGRLEQIVQELVTLREQSRASINRHFR
jgi:hypothetical protein